jgi:tetratricopeptide (TPR) repeat protein
MHVETLKRFLATFLLASFLFAAPSNGAAPNAESSRAGRQDNAAQGQSALLTEADQLSAQVMGLFKQGKFDKALPLAERALALRESALGPQHIMVGNALINVAEIYLAKGKRKEARTMYQRAVAIYEKEPAADKAEFTYIFERYLCVLSDAQETVEAQAARKRLFKLYNGFEYDETLNRAVSLPMPNYLPEAKRRMLSGAVVARVAIDESGKVIAVKVLCGHPLLVQGAEGAIWKGRYQPALVSGKPAKILDVVTYRFFTQKP